MEIAYSRKQLKTRAVEALKALLGLTFAIELREIKRDSLILQL